MRYMGDISLANPGLFSGTAPLDAVTKGQLVALMPTLTEAQGEDLVELAYATSYGKRDRLVKIGLGFAAGVAVSVAAARVLKKRK